VRSWFRIGLRVGVLAGAAFALVVAARTRRSDGQGSLATGVHGQWPDVRRSGADPDGHSTGDHHPHGQVTVPREAAPMGAPPAVASRDTGPAEPEASEPREHLDSEEAAAAGKADGGPAWVEPDGKVCPPTHPVKAKMSSRLYHLPGMLAYDRTVPDRCYVDPAAAEADGFTRAKR
jgi:hypothetical protein